MKLYPLFIFLILVCNILLGCKTTQQVNTGSQLESVQPGNGDHDPQEQETLKPSGELRGFVITSGLWEAATTDLMRENIVNLMDMLAEAKYNLVFFNVDGKYNPYYFYYNGTKSEYPASGMPDFDPLDVAIEAAHQKGLKIYAVIDFFGIWNNEYSADYLKFMDVAGDSSKSGTAGLNQEEGVHTLGIILSRTNLPETKTYLKNTIGRFLETYNIDGLNFDLSDSGMGDLFTDGKLSQTIDPDEQPLPETKKELLCDRFMDLLEDITVEAMLLKPYLVNSIIISKNEDDSFIYRILEEGIVDFIIPKVDINIENPEDEHWLYWEKSQQGKDHRRSIYPLFSMAEDSGNQIEAVDAFILENGMEGFILSMENVQREKSEPLRIPRGFKDPSDLPVELKKVTPYHVVGLNVSALLSLQVPEQAVRLFQGKKKKIPDSGGYIGFIASNQDTIDIETSARSITLTTNNWSLPFKYTVQDDNSLMRESPWVEFRRMPSKITNNLEYHFLCKTEYPASAWISGVSVKVYTTGIFFKTITLKKGANRVRADILTPDSIHTFYEREFIYEEKDKMRRPIPLWIDESSVEPAVDLELLPDDKVHVGFKGSLGQEAYVELFPGGMLFKCIRDDHEDFSVYRADIPLRKLHIGEAYQMLVRLIASVDTIKNPIYEFPLKNTFMPRQPEDFPVVKIIRENSRLTYNMGPVRLGGPIRSELGPGVLMKVNGKLGENYRIRLNEVENGVIPEGNVEVLPDETVQPTYFISSISCGPGNGEDVISIPYPEPVPYAVYPQPDQNRIVVILYGAKTSSTWITHRAGRQIVDKVTWEQQTPDTYRVHVNLKTSKIWGYDIRPDGKQLMLRLKYAPEYNLTTKMPLSGLKIAIEAGHGGQSTGAIGLSGLVEKDINLDLSLKLEEILESRGAEVLQVRKTDTTMSLIEKRDRILSSDADLHISIHANAAGTSRGYLRVPGTSTYYHNPFWAPLAENVYDRLLELGLAEFGVVGSFNYTVIRITQMPSILVEQAFMTHAEDEEKLADPQFRLQMAEKICEGIVDYVSYLNDD